MKYMGSKRTMAKYLLPFILENRNRFDLYLEPFVGGANMIEKVTGFKARIGCDVNHYVIEYFKAVQGGWLPPDKITKEQWEHIRDHKDLYHPAVVAFAGIYLSFAGSWFSTYSKGIHRGKERNYAAEGVRSTKRQLPLIKDVLFFHMSFDQIPLDKIPKAIIYCDPPYRGTIQPYVSKFDHDLFYKWCIYTRLLGHQIYISEYSMPEPFRCIYTHERAIGVYSKSDRIERLYTL